MSSGVHYADFQIAELAGSPCIGIVRPIPGLDAEAYEGDEVDEDEDFCFVGTPHLEPDFFAQRSDEWGSGNVHACEYSCEEGDLSWSNWDDEKNEGVHWEGMDGCRTGDTVAMLLNLGQGTLTIYKNNRRLGVMMDGLSGPYCCSLGHSKPAVVCITWPSGIALIAADLDKVIWHWGALGV
ncbi:hypothetical protein THAOC_28778 [Thalassiosira oceanica]|uniref:B30.2/SPRY domain-containing protein n=1 Tax=Thalassiosira oceanica TaxID=159749 RepID=K0RZC0_THAOC|nr:hypothetical protein THAOC_28778 [Thalassiosira oceanica]|eukprot:EJK51997.1 hypothetical protein THAOC_28778 [Thalassiosira oceanica]